MDSLEWWKDKLDSGAITKTGPLSSLLADAMADREKYAQEAVAREREEIVEDLARYLANGDADEAAQYWRKGRNACIERIRSRGAPRPDSEWQCSKCGEVYSHRCAARPKLEKLPLTTYPETKIVELYLKVQEIIDSHNAMQDAIEILQKERR